jgi:ribosomal protein S12 methylthiotransferase accessory factor
MHARVVGEGPAVAAVRAALEDVDATVTVEPTSGTDGTGGDPPTDPHRDARDRPGDGAAAGDEGRPDLGVVVAPAGDDRFERPPARTWLAVEVGGIGGHPLADIDASVAGFDATGGDGPAAGYQDLRARVASTVEAPSATATGDPASVRLAGAVAGRVAVAAVNGESPGGTLFEVRGTTVGSPRTVLPVPASQGVDDRTPRRTYRDVDASDASARMERAIDERVGLVTQVGERESFPLPYYVARTADTTAYADARAAELAAGVDVGWDAAFLKAVGEALERYSAGVYRTGSFVRAPARTRARPVTPDAFVRPAGATTPGVDDPVAWVAGENLATGESVSLPAAFVHYPPHTDRLGPAITTGLGLGNSGVEALLSGLYETIERDATMLAWYSTYEPLAVSVTDERTRAASPEAAADYATLRRRARSEGLSATALLVTADVDVPVVAAAVHRDPDGRVRNGPSGDDADDGWPRFAAGSAADVDGAAAARDALAEALQNWMELRAMGPERASEEDAAVGAYADFPQAAREFLDAPATVPAAEVGPEAPPAGAAELDALVDRVEETGLSVYASRLTPRDVDALGFEAVRVLVPAAQPLFVGEPYFGDRAETVPRELGFEPRLDRPYHPFP